MKNCLKIFFLFILLPLGIYGQTFQVKVIGISDGDTFTGLNRDSLQLKFRIYCIDAPEKKQAFRSRSKEHLASLIFGHYVTVCVSSQEKWGRYVATVTTNDGRDFGEEMLQAGLAWYFEQYDNSEEYAQVEQTARDNKNGLWSDPHAVPPWEFRKMVR
jgi:endonuclease YncB( thermonuclease family)